MSASETWRRTYRKDDVVTSPLPIEQPQAIETPTPQPAPLSIGAGIALTGISATGFLLVAFLLVLYFTDILVANSAARAANADNPNAASGTLIALVISFLPIIFSYKLCARIIDKASAS